MLSDDIMKTPQPRSVRVLSMSAPIAILLFICIYRIYHVILYVDAFLFLLVSIEDFILKYVEIYNLRTRRGKIRGFNNKFLKNSFFSLCLTAVCLGWASILKGDTGWMLIFGFPPICVLPFMIIVEARVLLEVFRVKTVED